MASPASRRRASWSGASTPPAGKCTAILPDADGHLDVRCTRLLPASIVINGAGALVCDDGRSRLSAGQMQAMMTQLRRSIGKAPDDPLVLEGELTPGEGNASESLQVRAIRVNHSR